MVNETRLVTTFLDLVKIDSPSGSEMQAAQYVADRFRAAGLTSRLDEIGNVIARLEGKGKPLFLNAHTDNVQPAQGIAPVVSEGIIRSDGRTVLGADDLAGVAALLEGIQTIVEQGLPHLPLEIAITVQEEVGLKGAKALALHEFKAREGIVLDGHGPVGVVTTGSPSQNTFRAVIHGKAAHSGLEPEKGINAVKVAADALHAMKLGRIDHETTANIGLIHGGSARNIVPDRVELVGEARSRNVNKLERQTRHMRLVLEKAARAHRAQVEIEVERSYNQYKFGRNDPVVKRLVRALKSIGRAPRFEVTGGGSDANIWNAKGIRCVVTSVGYEDIHTTAEFIPVSELCKCAELVVAVARP